MALPVGASNNDSGNPSSNMTKKKRENLGVALEVRGGTGAAACRELLPAADGGSAGLLVGGRSKRRR